MKILSSKVKLSSIMLVAGLAVPHSSSAQACPIDSLTLKGAKSAFTRPVIAKRVGSECRWMVRLDPAERSWTAEFRMIQVPAGTAFLASPPQAALVTSDTVKTVAGQAVTLRVRMAIGRGPQNIPMILRLASAATAPTDSVIPLELISLPAPLDLAITGGSDRCGADICVDSGLETTIALSGLDIDAVDLAKPAQLSVDNGPPSPLKLDRGPTGVFGTAELGKAPGPHCISITLPLRVDRIEATGPIKNDTTLHVTSNVRNHLNHAAIFFGDGKTPLERISQGARNVQVMLVVTTAQKANALVAGRSYHIREEAGGTQSPIVAQLFVEDVQNDRVTGSLQALLPTARPNGKGSAPALVIVDNTDSIIARVQFAIRPMPRAERITLIRADKISSTPTVYPGEVVTARLEGPGVDAITGVQFGDAKPTITRPGAERDVEPDVLPLTIHVPENAHATEDLILFNEDGGLQRFPLTVAQVQRPRPLDFVSVLLTSDGLPTRTPIVSKGVPQRPLTVSGLSRLSLNFDRSRIDSVASIFGVQYVNVSFSLFDHHNTQVATGDRCFAIVPPDLNGRPYQTEGNCTRLNTTVIPVSMVLGEALSRSTVRSSVQMTFRHDASSYPGMTLPDEVKVVVERGGHFAIEPRVNLPGALLGWTPGKSVQPAMTYTGAVLDVQAFRRKAALPFSFQGGIVIASPIAPVPGTTTTTSSATTTTGPATTTTTTKTETPAPSTKAEFAVATGMAYTIKNMLGTVALDFYLGYMFPLAEGKRAFKDGFIAFRPGFTVPLGTGK